MTTLFKDSIEEFRCSLSVRGLSLNTIRAYVTDVRLFLSESYPLGLTVETAQMESRAAMWLNHNRQTWEPRTMMRKITSLRSYLEFLGFSDPLLKFKAPMAAVPIPHPLPGGLADLERLILVAECEDHVVLVVLCGLIGMRISEALSIKSEDFDLRERMVIIRGKGDKSRRVPVSPRAYSLLVDRIARRFLAGGGTLLSCSDRAARKTITVLGKRAEISRPIASHDLRATFATMAYQKTNDIAAVSRLLGHANVNTTMLYIGTDLDRLRASAAFAEEDED